MKLRVNSKRIASKQAFLFFAAAVMSFSALSFQAYFNGEAQAAVPYLQQVGTFTVPSPSESMNNTPEGVVIDQNDNVYVSTGSSYGFVTKLDSDKDVSWKIQTTRCGSPDTYSQGGSPSIAVSGNGTVYVLVNEYSNGYSSCVKKYTASGEFIEELSTGGYAKGVAVSDAGNLYVLRDSTVTVFDGAGQELQTISPGAGRTGIIVSIQVQGDRLFMTMYWSNVLQVFDMDGQYLSEHSISQHTVSGGYRTYVDASGILYVLDTDRVRITQYASVSAVDPMVTFTIPQQSLNGRAARLLVVNSQGLVMVAPWYVDANGDSTFTVFGPSTIERPQFAVQNLRATWVNDTAAHFEWELSEDEPYPLEITYKYQLMRSNGDIVWTKTGRGPVLYTQTYEQDLIPGTEYRLTVTPVNPAGDGPDATVTFTTYGDAPVDPDPEEPEQPEEPQATTEARVEVRDGQKYIVIDGEGVIPESFTIPVALLGPSSGVVLNGVNLKMCTQTLGMTYEEMMAMFANGSDLPPEMIEMIAQRVTDQPTCYLARQNPEEEGNPDRIASIEVWVEGGFDTSKRGTVVIGGSLTATFGEEAAPTSPTVIVDNSAPLATAPTIAKRPTFRGTATPGARITVTVHSDPVSCSTVANGQGAWSCTLPKELPAGDHTVRVAVVNPDETTQELGPFPVRVANTEQGSAPGSSAPSTVPAAQLLRQVRQNAQATVAQADSSETTEQTDGGAIEEVTPEDRSNNQADIDESITPISSQEESTNAASWLWWVVGAGVLLVGIVLLAVRRTKGSEG